MYFLPTFSSALFVNYWKTNNVREGKVTSFSDYKLKKQILQYKFFVNFKNKNINKSQKMTREM